MPVWPTDEVERSLAQRIRMDRGVSPETPIVVVGVDEVGRGALAGPVYVGACAVVVGPSGIEPPLPEGVRDSKTLSAKAREKLEPLIHDSSAAWGLGWVEAHGIDDMGISAALTQAALLAIDAMTEQGVTPDAIIVDGAVDVLTESLLRRAEAGASTVPFVHVQAKADRDCVSVAGASVIAKTARDRVMEQLAADAPHYGWDKNKGYGSVAHREAIILHGPHPQHRHSWNLPSQITPRAHGSGVL